MHYLEGMNRMAAGKDKTSWMVESGFGLILILLLGSGLGYLFAGDLFNKPPHALLVSLALGLVWALFVLHWIDLLAQTFAFSSDPVPSSLDLADRGAVRAHVEKLRGGAPIVNRARHLLGSWAGGADPGQLIALASFQSEQARNTLRAGAAFALILIVGAMWQGGQTVLAWGAFVVVAITLYARQNLLSRIDAYLGVRLLSRLPGSGSVAAASGTSDVGKALGEAVDKAFRDYVPQPERMAEAIQKAVDSAGSKNSEIITRLQEALSQHAEQVHTAGGGWSSQIEGVLAQHADNLQSSTQQLASQLDKIAALEQDIEKILHVQEAVDNTIKSVTTTEEFRETLAVLRNHVEESDKLLRSLAKPRKIRLVESDAKVTETAASHS